YQPVVGGPAVLAWLNLYELTSRPGFRGDAVAETARRLGVDAAGLEHILDDLERAGLLVRRGQAVALCMPPPDAAPPAGAEAPAGRQLRPRCRAWRRWWLFITSVSACWARPSSRSGAVGWRRWACPPT